MGMFDRMESRIERAVNGVFAKAFRSEVSPLEIASAMRKAMDNRATILGRGRTVVPNMFTVELSANDYERLTQYREDLEDELIAAAQEHAETQAYQPGGPLRVEFTPDDALETGVFRIRPSTARHPGPRQSQRASGYDAGYDAVHPAVEREPREPLPYAEEYADDPADPSWAQPADDEPPVTTPHHAEPAPRAYSVTERPWLDIDGERYPLIGAITVLGRDDIADVVLDDPGISRRHCEIRITHDGPRLVGSIRDLNSTNGTFVNGERTTSTHLQDGDRVTVGRTSFTYRSVGR